MKQSVLWDFWISHGLRLLDHLSKLTRSKIIAIFSFSRLRGKMAGKNIVFYALVNFEILGYFASITCLCSD